MHWNIKKRADDKRGYKTWSKDSKAKVRQSSMRHLKLNDRAWLVEVYLKHGRTTVDIAKEIGCVTSTVFHALNALGIPRRNRKETVTRGVRHYQWKGGTSFLKRDTHATPYKVWRLNVFVRDGFACQTCGAKKPIQAHHVLFYKDFPDLRFRVDNGITLCKSCHYGLHDVRRSVIKDRELLGSPERIISSQAKAGMPLKVQRLEAETRPVGNASTSAVQLLKTVEDIVRSW